MEHSDFMAVAIDLAKKAQQQGEVPVGAVLVQDNNIITEGFNQVITKSDPTAHAEIMAIRQAGKELNNYRLLNTTLYVTLEPCIMCFGAIIHARIGRVVFATTDKKTGCLGGCIDIIDNNCFNHKAEIISGVMAQESSTLLKSFFQQKRKKTI